MPDMTDLGATPGFDALQDITNDNEGVETVLGSGRGLTKIEGGREQHIDYAIGIVATDRRILFVNLDSEGDDDRGELRYGDLAAIERTDDVLELTTTGGAIWQFPLTEPDTEAVEAACNHLDWVGTVRRRLVSCRNDIEMAAGEMRKRADDLEWEGATETYQAARQQLDDLICTVQYTEPLDETVLAPELADIERTLEAAYARLYVDRAESQLDLGRHLVENEDYEQARKVLEQAQEYYEQARDRSDVVERGDAFQFGTQRALQTDLEDLGWEIETVAAEPIRQAHDEKILAQRTDDPADAIEHWEAAFRGYGNVLTLEWGDGERHFAGDPTEVREEMRQAAGHLIGLHERVARETWNDGATLEQDGQKAAGFERCKAATEHLERAHELAEEFEPDRAATLETRREKMSEALIEIKHAAQDQSEQEPSDEASAPTDPDDADSDDELETGDQSEPEADEWPPSVSDLSEMDTHHEITLELDDVTEAIERESSDERDAERSEPNQAENGQARSNHSQ